MQTFLDLKQDFDASGEVKLGSFLALGARRQDPLSDDELKLRDEQERIIRDGAKASWAIGAALKVIHDNRLWRINYVSFNKYTTTKWGFTPGRAYQYMDSASVLEVLTIGKCEPLPDNERQMRALVRLMQVEKKDLKSMKDPEKAAILRKRQEEAGARVVVAYQEACERRIGEKPPGGKLVEEVVDRVLGKRSTTRATKKAGDPAKVQKNAQAVPESDKNLTLEQVLIEADKYQDPRQEVMDAVDNCLMKLLQTMDESDKVDALGYLQDKAVELTISLKRSDSVGCSTRTDEVASCVR